MIKDQPLWHKLYSRPEYAAVARAVGYKGLAYRDLVPIIETLGKEFGKEKVLSAVYQLTVFDGQMRVNPPPLAKVEFRAEVRKLCIQLLGPPPEKWDAFYSDVREPPPNPYKQPAPKGEPEAPPAEKPKRTRKRK